MSIVCVKINEARCTMSLRCITDYTVQSDYITILANAIVDSV